MATKHWLIAGIILMMGYKLYTGLSSLVEERKKQHMWTELDHSVMVNKCIEDARDMSIKYPGETRIYCDCAIRKIQARLNKPEYEAVSTSSLEEQKKTLLPLFQDCLTDYEKNIKTVSELYKK